LIVGLAFLSWIYLQPALELSSQVSLAWIVPMWVRNMVLMTLVAGGLHLWFYTFTGQGDALKFDPRDQGGGRLFTFKSQVHDNMFWTLASGVTVCTAYEAMMIWAFSTGVLTPLAFADAPVWFIALFFLIPIWESFYFYWIHRWLHWKPLYDLAHHVHHRNTNVGPWSGLSMHPVEHVIYLGSVLIHWAISSHPVHVLYHLQYYCLTAATTHSGYEGIVLRDKNRLAMGTFHHQMHHRYFECNYGSLEIPWDKWFGSWHDGTPQGRAMMKERRQRLAGKLGG
jgi:lathosterol oxidase